MQQSDFENATEGTNGNLAVSQIVSALNQGDHETAGHLLRDALERTPHEKQLLRLAAKQRRQAERFTRVYSLLKETQTALEGDEFVRAVGAFREAANLSQGFVDLEKATFEMGVDQAAELGNRNWRIARALLEDTGRLNPQLVIPEKHWQNVKAAERAETIANVLEETALAKAAELGRARERLIRTLEQYPEDAGLASRLKSIESIIEDNRKWDERQKCLMKLTDLRDAMQREEDPAQAGKYVPQSEALAAAYSGDREFSNVVEDITHQVISAERAAAALQQDRIEDCLEECAWVLSRMRHHQLFLNLKKKAEERELSLADEYSNSISRIKELLAAGELAEADALCSKARAQLPQFADLQELKREIDERRAKEDHGRQENAENVRRLLERGERQLREHQYRPAEQSFSNALKLRPDDKKFSGQLVWLLHGYARSVVRENPQSAEEALQLTERILPGTPVPADLAGAVRQTREHAKSESIRWSALDKVGALNAQVESARKREEIAAVRAEVEKNNFAGASHADVREAACALISKMDSRTAAFDRTQARRPVVYRIISIAAVLALGAGLAIWLNSNRPLPPVETSAVARPVPVVTPQAVSNSAEVSDVKPTPKPASLEIRAAGLAPRIKVDRVFFGKAAAHKARTRELPAGESADARTIAAVKNPPTSHPAVPAPKTDELQWQSIDKGNPDALRAFVSQYPNSAYASQAKQQIETVLVAREDSDWSSSDHNSRTALEDFLKKHPDGRHASAASSALADIDETAWKKVNRHDQASLESYLREAPTSRYRNQAEVDLANIRLSQSNETAAVLMVISRLANAWRARDLNSIVAIQRNLNKREVKAELSHVTELDMQISPASPPRIEGTQAVVLCRRQASQTFSDGTRKQIPESTVSFVLAKHDGNWTIEGTR